MTLDKSVQKKLQPVGKVFYTKNTIRAITSRSSNESRLKPVLQQLKETRDHEIPIWSIDSCACTK